MSKEVIWCDDYEKLMVEKGCLNEEEALVLHLHVKGYSDVAISMHDDIFISERTVQRRIAKLKQVYDALRQLYPWLPPREKQKKRIERLRKEREKQNQENDCDDYDDDCQEISRHEQIIDELKEKILIQELIIKQLQKQLEKK